MISENKATTNNQPVNGNYYYWYYSRNMPKADVVFSKKNLRLYGYADEPEYEFIEKYDLRFLDIGTLDETIKEFR